MTDELPPPDVMDTAGRMRRLVLAFVVGVVVAAIAYGITYAMAKDDIETPKYVTTRNANRFVFYMTALAGAAAFSITLAIANHIAKKRERERDRLPRAQQR